MHTFVIAELGIAHEGSRDEWRRLIDVALACDADAIKGQFWSDSATMAAHRGRTDVEWFEHYRTPLGWLEDIPADKRMCTAYLVEDVPAILPLVVKCKIGSWESLRGEALADAYDHCGRRQELIISTGGWDATRLGALPARWNTAYLHCAPLYPTPLKRLRLSAIQEYDLDGLSDHTGSWQTGARAVLAGARIIEAHVRLDHTPERNPDFTSSLKPSDFRLYVRAIREAETWM